MKTRKPRKAAAMMLTAVIALFVAMITAPGTAAQGAQGKAKKYKGTRAIIVDATTGDLRLPTQQEVDQAVQSLSSLAPRPVEEARETTLPNGAVAVSLEGSGVVLARPNGDGTFETRCVFTFEEGVAFLGIVEDESVL